MGQTIIGVDGGGGHTEATVVDVASGRAVATARSGPSNPWVVGLDGAAEAIAAAVREVRSQAGGGAPPVALVCCVSGAGRPAEREGLERALGAMALADRVIVAHDAVGLLAAAVDPARMDRAIAVIAGTGSFVWACDGAGREHRADGWGSLMGDEGGAFRIGQEGLRACFRAFDGRGPETALTGAALQHFSAATADALLQSAAAGTAVPRDRIAGFAPDVLRMAERMDPVAVGIVEEAVRALIDSALAVRRRLGLAGGEGVFVLGGGLFQEATLFRERFTATVAERCPGDGVAAPRWPLSVGAARYGMWRLGLAAPEPPESIAQGRPAPGAPSGEARSPSGAAPSSSRADRERQVFEECRRLPTEQPHPDGEALDGADALTIVRFMNREDQRVAPAVEKVLPAVADAVERIEAVLRAGGRLFYLGAGTSGRLGCLDAAECPPTFGTPPHLVQGVIAGGVQTLLRSREGAEDRTEAAVEDLQARGFGAGDALVGIAASRRTPYVARGLAWAKGLGALTVLVTCSPPEGPMDDVDVVIAPVVGPETVMGSTRLKAGTAQKLVLNMLTTAVMIRMGKVWRGRMVDLQQSCEKLAGRARRTVMTLAEVDYDRAGELLSGAGGSVKTALVMALGGCDAAGANQALAEAGGQVGRAIEKLGDRAR